MDFSRLQCCRLKPMPIGMAMAGLLVGLLHFTVAPAQAADAPAKLSSPVPYQVLQRSGFVPQMAHSHAPGGAQRGAAMVAITGEFPRHENEQFDFRVVPLPGVEGAATEWAALVTVRGENNKLTSSASVAAGGWYRLEVRQRVGDAIVHAAHIEPFGVGEVFLVSGQSYAAGANDELQSVVDPLERVVAFDPVKKTWQVAHDPQPNVGDGGTIWPPLGDTLAPLWSVPIGFVNVAVGATSSRQWLPETELFARMAAAGAEQENFRAVLWQQGESDVIEKVTTETYVKNLSTIRAAMAKTWKFEPPWLLAKSTLHPRVYNNPEGEQKIRSAIDQLVTLPGFRPGPDTDILDGENRGGVESRQHFSRLGQRRAAQLWFVAVWHEFNRAESNGSPTIPADQPAAK